MTTALNTEKPQNTHDNRSEFKRLDEENRWLNTAYVVTSTAMGASIVVPEPITKLGSFLAGTVGANLVLKRKQKVCSVLRNARAIDAEFKEQQVQTFLDLPVPDQGRLDLLVKFPNPPRKAIFAIALRTQGKATIFYNEGKENFYIRRGKTGFKPWTPDHIERLGVQGFWLRQNRQEELFGTSRNERNRPIVKLLVITGETKIGQHSDSLYTQVGDQRVLLLKRRSSIYVLEESQLLPFIKAWLDPPA
jgi:hypothetical protein